MTNPSPTPMDALKEARDLAMKNTAEARIPECGDFAEIAQNLDWAITQLEESPDLIRQVEAESVANDPKFKALMVKAFSSSGSYAPAVYAETARYVDSIITARVAAAYEAGRLAASPAAPAGQHDASTADLPLPQPMRVEFERPHGLVEMFYYTADQMRSHGEAERREGRRDTHEQKIQLMLENSKLVATLGTLASSNRAASQAASAKAEGPALRKCMAWECGEGIPAYFHGFLPKDDGIVALIERADGWVMTWHASGIRFEEWPVAAPSTLPEKTK